MTFVYALIYLLRTATGSFFFSELEQLQDTPVCSN